MKKFAVTCAFINPTYGRERAGNLEVYYIKKAIEEAGHHCDIIGYRNNRNNHLPFYIDSKDADYSSYDGIFIQQGVPQFFGGQIKNHTISLIEGLASAKCQLYHLVTDPLIKPNNPARILDRFNLCQDITEVWDKMLENAIYVFPGNNLEKFWGFNSDRIIYFDLFTYSFKDYFGYKSRPSLIEPDKKWDVVYFGRNRKTFRENILRKYFPEDTNNLLIGYKSKKINATQKLPMKHSELYSTISECKVSLIVADEEHMDNVITYRFFETLNSDCLAAIPLEYDPSKRLIKNPILRDLLYVSSAEDVRKLINSYSSELLYLQKEELKRIFMEFNQKLDLEYTPKNAISK